MEEKDMVFLDFDETQSYVLVEKNKKRQKERQRNALKRVAALGLLLVLIFGAIKLFPYAKELIVNFFDAKSDTVNPSTDGEGQNENGGNEQNNGGNGFIDTNKDTPPKENEESTDTETDTESNENNVDTSTDTENTNNEAIKEGYYKINEVGASKYVAVNESGCEFDFSAQFSKISLDEIYRKYGSDSPVVLITHSSVLETYSDGESYSTDDSFYAESQNVGDIGEVICKRLNALGIGAIQLNELYASGAIHSSQAEYKKSLEETLKKYPSISYVFNISRGTSINDDLSMNKSYITEGGKKYAQISLISGTSWDIASSEQIENVRFAFDFSKFMNKRSQNFVRENVISRYPLSQNISPFAVNVEIGDFSNSFEEAERSAEVFAQLLYEYISD